MAPAHNQGCLLGEAGVATVEMRRMLKLALDPKNILNRGKIFSL
jgi:hypothetical protein